MRGKLVAFGDDPEVLPAKISKFMPNICCVLIWKYWNRKAVLTWKNWDCCRKRIPMNKVVRYS
jgi:hypothetical protein